MPHGEECAPFAVSDEAADTPAELGRDDRFRGYRLCPSDPSRLMDRMRWDIPVLPAMRSDRIGTGDESLPGSLDGSRPHRPSGFRGLSSTRIAPRVARSVFVGHLPAVPGWQAGAFGLQDIEKDTVRLLISPNEGCFKSSRVFVISLGCSVFAGVLAFSVRQDHSCCDAWEMKSAGRSSAPAMVSARSSSRRHFSAYSILRWRSSFQVMFRKRKGHSTPYNSPFLPRLLRPHLLRPKDKYSISKMICAVNLEFFQLDKLRRVYSRQFINRRNNPLLRL